MSTFTGNTSHFLLLDGNESIGYMESELVSSNMHLTNPIREKGIVNSYLEEGTFIPDRNIFCRNEPTVSSDHIATINSDEPVKYSRVIEGNNFIWLYIEGDRSFYIPICNFNSLTGIKGIIRGKLIYKE